MTPFQVVTCGPVPTCYYMYNIAPPCFIVFPLFKAQHMLLSDAWTSPCDSLCLLLLARPIARSSPSFSLDSQDSQRFPDWSDPACLPRRDAPNPVPSARRKPATKPCPRPPRYP